MHEGNYSKNIEARVTRFSFLLVANMARIKRQKHPDRSLKIFSVTVIIYFLVYKKNKKIAME